MGHAGGVSSVFSHAMGGTTDGFTNVPEPSLNGRFRCRSGARSHSPPNRSEGRVELTRGDRFPSHISMVPEPSLASTVAVGLAARDTGPSYDYGTYNKAGSINYEVAYLKRPLRSDILS